MVATSKSLLIVSLLVMLGLLWPESAGAAFDNLPTGLTDVDVVDGLGQPTAFDFLPQGEDGDMLVTSKEGVVYLVDIAPPAVVREVLDISGSVCAGGEQGLLGIAVHPDLGLASNRFVYLYYTNDSGNNCANRVSRFAIDASGDLSDEEVLINKIPAPGGNHNAGDLQFGGDGLLYISVGDGGKDLRTGETQDGNGNARRLDLLNGKILRITPDGDIPNGNPFQGNDVASCAENGRAPSATSGDVQQSAKAKKKKRRQEKRRKRRERRRERRENASICGEIFATGLRNPFRIAFDPDGGGDRFFINDVGGGGFEEVNEGANGADYGWNKREGPCPINQIASNCTPNGNFDDPFFAYRTGSAPAPLNNCRTITGGAFVPDGGTWPNEFDDVYLFAEFGCDRLFALDDSGADPEVVLFGENEAAVHLKFGPDGNLYYAALNSGEVRRISPV